MNLLARQKGQAFAKFLSQLPVHLRSKGNEDVLRRSNNEYQDFLHSFAKNECYLCKKDLKNFDKESPCLHWLLKKSGAKFKKSDFLRIASKFRFFQIQSYLRWVANQNGFAKNINDLRSSDTSPIVFEESIRWGNIEWSFSCSESDYLGHKDTKSGCFPHYHFQMRVDGYPIIKYNNLHIPFHETDVIEIEATRFMPELIKRKHTHGEGMADLLNQETLELIVKNSKSEGNPDEAQLNIQSFIVADEGTKINGDDLANLFEEAREKNVPVASLLHLLPNVNVNVDVYPGPGVVEGFPRNGRSKENKGNK